MNRRVSVRYFALFRERAGKSHEVIETSAATAEELYGQLKEKYGFGLCTRDIRLAVNSEFTDLGHGLRDGDELVFIPPVAGG